MRPRIYRLDLATENGSRIITCDGQTARQLDPTSDSGKAEILAGERGKDLLSQSYLDDVLICFRSTGERLFLAGIESFDGADAYRIEVEGLGGGRYCIFLDTKSLLEIRRLIWTDPQDTPVEITYEYGGVDELPMPVRQTVTTATERG